MKDGEGGKYAEKRKERYEEEINKLWKEDEKRKRNNINKKLTVKEMRKEN
jgi:hypothetical protein